MYLGLFPLNVHEDFLLSRFCASYPYANNFSLLFETKKVICTMSLLFQCWGNCLIPSLNLLAFSVYVPVCLFFSQVEGTPERPRLSVYRSNKHLYVQVIDDSKMHTLAAASTMQKAIAEQIDYSSGPTIVSSMSQYSDDDQWYSVS